MVVQSRKEQQAEKKNNEITSLGEAFPGLSFDTSDQFIEEDREEVFYLWETKKELFEVYKIVRNYLTENYGIDSTVLLRLIDAKGLDIWESLEGIPFIHGGYTDVIIESWKDGKSEDTKSYD